MRRRIYALAAVFLVVLIAALVVRWADRDGRFDLLAARIDNSGPVDSVRVAEILKPYFGESLLTMDIDTLTAALGSIEGLKRVSVTVSFPHSIIVNMTPERPAALVLSSAGDIPVTTEGVQLPPSWADPSLPVLSLEGSPGDDYIRTGLDLLLKRELYRTAEVRVCEWGILVVQDGVPVMFDGESAPADWKTWEAIKTSVRASAEMVDMRYGGQAVIRTAGGTEV